MALRFPSLDYLLTEARQAFLRFPLTILSALVAVVIAIYLVETEDQTFNRLPYINAMLCAVLGISLYFCVGILAARQQFSLRSKLIAQGLAALILLGIYFTLPDASSTHNISLPYIRYAIYSIIIHLLVSFVPFLFTQQLNGFWNYNKSLFIRLLTGLLYSGFLYAGLVLALFALHTLFELDIHEELFADLFIVILGLFNTWFFVAGVPTDFDALEENTSYPKGLKVFSQYVLLPLLLLYLLILYGYGIKIIINWDWPKGIVSYLIMCVSVLGILTMLLIYPYALHTGNQWIRKVSKGYYLLLLPLLVLLFLAIGMRLADYGFTINRYIILAIGIWLTVVCLYFLSGRNNIKFVPVSLAVVLLIISIGPWSIFSVSERDQVTRLQAVLQSATIMESDKLVKEVYWVKDSLPDFYSPEFGKNDGILNDSLHNEVKSILDYLDDHHGFTTIQPWYSQNLDSLIVVAESDTSKNKQWISEAGVYMMTLGLPYEYRSKTNDYETYINFDSQADKALDVSGWDQLVFMNHLYYFNPYPLNSDSISRAYTNTVSTRGNTYTIDYSPEKPEWFTLTTKTDTVQFPIGQFIKRLSTIYKQNGNRNLPDSSMSLIVNSHNKRYKLMLESVKFNEKSDSLTLQSIRGNLLIGRKK